MNKKNVICYPVPNHNQAENYPDVSVLYFLLEFKKLYILFSAATLYFFKSIILFLKKNYFLYFFNTFFRGKYFFSVFLYKAQKMFIR